MATRSTRPKLVAIVGPTATGKTELAIKLAKQFNGEIIAADSRTIYKGMDVGTAKPTKAERKSIPHWGFDLVGPGDLFSAAEFQKYAKAKIKQIQSRGKLPILVGGTGFYVDCVIFDFKFRPKADAKLRQKLEKLSVEQLQALITEKSYSMPENLRNRRHLVRTIETAGQIGSRAREPKDRTVIIGLMPPANVIKHRLQGRALQNFDTVVAETQELVDKYGRATLIRTAGIPYLTALNYLDQKISKTAALEAITAAEWQYARRQRTWFKRNPYIKWFNSVEEAFSFFETI